MFGLFMIALVIGLIWQYYSRTQKEHKSQASAGEQPKLNICQLNMYLVFYPAPELTYRVTVRPRDGGEFNWNGIQCAITYHCSFVIKCYFISTLY